MSVHSSCSEWVGEGTDREMFVVNKLEVGAVLLEAVAWLSGCSNSGGEVGSCSDGGGEVGSCGNGGEGVGICSGSGGDVGGRATASTSNGCMIPGPAWTGAPTREMRGTSSCALHTPDRMLPQCHG